MITTDRDKFLGSHLTKEVKEALRAEAAKRRIGMSELNYLILVDHLGRLGYVIPELADAPQPNHELRTAQ